MTRTDARANDGAERLTTTRTAGFVSVRLVPMPPRNTRTETTAR